MSLSTFFSDHRLAVNVAAISIIGLSLVFIQLAQVDSAGRYVMYGFFMFPIVPACVIMGKLVSDEKWEMFSFFKLSYFDVTTAWICLIICVPLWIALYYYLEKVVPNTYGIQQPLCFCLKKKRNISSNGTNRISSSENQMMKGVEGFNQEDPIQIHNLVKQFGKLKAVNGVQFSIRQGEVFTILGHNGAGKTTLIYMLTGVLSPTEGDAMVYGNSVKAEIDKI
mmetsp:Transcript_41165/g.62598  ORF Transcript_41165/g.62598 Transcript_41165/m.62598 type:complete len:223 (+) Transcript_41165:696-1364(+)